MEQLRKKINFETLDSFLDLVRKFTDKSGIDEATLLELIMVAEELLVNIIFYAYPKNKDNGIAELKLSMVDENIKIELIDEGISFDPLTIVEPDVRIPLRERETGGMGIFFVKKIMDDIQYERKGNNNIVTLMKKVKIYAS